MMKSSYLIGQCDMWVL